jgi:5-methylcytosine-specific restriction enzyme subunit McrC
VYHPRTLDTALNGALCSGLRLALLATRDLELRVHLRRLMAEMDLEPGVAELDLGSLAGVRNGLDRRTAHYSPALVLIGLLLGGQSLSLDAPASELPLEGFLFDMNRFFQTLLSRFLREHLVNLTLLDEHQLHGVFSYDPHHNPQNRRARVPRPDFVVRQGQRSLAVLDAKYRDLWERDLPREMLYQLAVYALTESADHPVTTILYPTLSDQACDPVVTFQNAVSGANKARVVLRPVQLLTLDTLLRAGAGVAALRQRQALAARLVGDTRSKAA